MENKEISIFTNVNLDLRAEIKKFNYQQIEMNKEKYSTNSYNFIKAMPKNRLGRIIATMGLKRRITNEIDDKKLVKVDGRNVQQQRALIMKVCCEAS